MSDIIFDFNDYLPDAVKHYIDMIRNNNPNAFTRHRKITVCDLISQMLTRRGRSQWSELMDFYNTKNEIKDISETGFYLARKKFNPEAIRVMCNEFCANSYDKYDERIQKFKGLYLLSIDGSKINVPNTKKNDVYFGKLKNEANQPTMALISTLHDCLNGVKLDILVDKARGSERDLASKHIKHFCDNYIGKAIFVMDRGYPSMRLFDQIIDNDQFFLIRIPSNFLSSYTKDINIGDDKIVEVIFDRITTNDYRDDIKFRQKLMNTKYQFRFTKVKIGTDKEGKDTFELLISNLPKDNFSIDDLKDIYHKRWEIETSYNRLKNRMNIEEFSGYDTNLVLQDIYADTWLFNLVAFSILEANYKKPLEQKNGKYTIKHNFNKSIGIMKRLVLKILMCADPKDRTKYVEQLDTNIESNIVWVENNRENIRKNAVNKSKISYRKTH